MVKRKISFYERKKEMFWTKGKVHIMGKFLYWTFRRWEIQSPFDSKSWCKIIFSPAWNTMFFEWGNLESWWKVDIFLVFLNFSWYSTTWEICLLVQWKVALVGHHFSGDITIKKPYWVDDLLHRPTLYPIFSYWVI